MSLIEVPGAPPEPKLRVVVELTPRTGDINVHSPAPPAVVFDLLITAARMLWTNALQALEQKPDIVIPTIVPPANGNGGRHQ